MDIIYEVLEDRDECSLLAAHFLWGRLARRRFPIRVCQMNADITRMGRTDPAGPSRWSKWEADDKDLGLGPSSSPVRPRVNSFVSQLGFPCMDNGDDNRLHFIDLVWWLKEKRYVKDRATCSGDIGNFQFKWALVVFFFYHICCYYFEGLNARE